MITEDVTTTNHAGDIFRRIIADRRPYQIVAFEDDDPDHYGWHLNVGGETYALPAVDLAPHVAFCRGAMPPEVYADWLEENGVDLPPEAYALLRHAAYTATSATE